MKAFFLAALFSLTLGWCAFLSFVLQPYIGRLMVPLFGGTPAVWNSCLVFFQFVLLLGYCSSHYITSRLPSRYQLTIVLALFVSAIYWLPITSPEVSDRDFSSPAWALFLLLGSQVAIPYFTLTLVSPLLQRWFSYLDHPSKQDPYFLSIASNIGSLTGLLIYPLVLEPFTNLRDQGQYWFWGYLIAVVLMASCAFFVPKTVSKPIATSGVPTTLPLKHWFLLAFIPSAWLVSVSQFITTDLAGIPLLWVIPLALYLVSFILAFQNRIRIPIQKISRVLAISCLIFLLLLATSAREPLVLVLSLHLLFFFLACLYCHRLVALARPVVQHLTLYYFILSLGGVCGGAMVNLFAPIVFRSLGFIEYPLLAIGLLYLRQDGQNLAFRRLDWLFTFLFAFLISGLISFENKTGRMVATAISFVPSENLAKLLRSAMLYGLPIICIYLSIDRRKLFPILCLVLLIGLQFDVGPSGNTIHLERSYLGMVRITESPDENWVRMVHGETIHGQQRRGSVVPATYYHPKSPVGRFFHDWDRPGHARIGVVGLGTGALAYYAQPEESWTFFELDPVVDRLARDTRYFRYLADAKTPCPTILGDARIQLQYQPDQSFDVLILDAFSSDSIPTHLITVEALQLYLQKLKPDGVLLFHLSNRYLDLPPIVDRLAQECGFVARVWDDRTPSAEGQFPSIWALVTKDLKLLPIKLGEPRWRYWGNIDRLPNTPLWGDQRLQLFSAWRRED